MSVSVSVSVSLYASLSVGVRSYHKWNDELSRPQLRHVGRSFRSIFQIQHLDIRAFTCVECIVPVKIQSLVCVQRCALRCAFFCARLAR